MTLFISNTGSKLYYENIDFFQKAVEHKNFDFYKDTKYIKYHISSENNERSIGTMRSASQKHLYFVDEETYKNAINCIKYDFNDNNLKTFISVSISFFHIFMETIASILTIKRKYPDMLFILNAVETKQYEYENFFQFLFDFLKYENINYVFLTDDFVLKVNNFYNFLTLEYCDINIDYVSNFAQTYIKKVNPNPTKKVYLSRKFTPSQRNLSAFNNLNIDINKFGINDIRVYDEYILEKYFREKGFEIVYGEKFKSISDQINFFNDVKTLISPTSSAIFNCIFMPPKGRVIELMTPLLPGITDFYQLHSNNYLNLSYTKEHKYLGIKSLLYSEKIIDYFENNRDVFNFMMDVS